MTTLTPALALPKPEATDLIANGWDAIADLADAVEARLRPFYVVKPTAQQVLNSAVAGNDTALFLDLAAGNVYEVVAHLAVSGNGTNDLRTQWANTGTMALVGARSGRGMGAAATARDAATLQLSGAIGFTAPIIYGTDAGGNIAWVREELLLSVTVAGRLTLQWAQSVSNAAATTIWNSSWLRAVPVGKL